MRPLLLLFFLAAISTDNFVEGAICKENFIGLTCDACGKGSRCIQCIWCTGFCSNSKLARSTGGVEYGSVEALYKIPFLKIFNDVDVLLHSDGIVDQHIVDIYKTISNVTREDCAICNDSPELNDFSLFTQKQAPPGHGSD